ncbi:uncharacterized protein LOC133905226 [Phragmites australis]|uniref:uncharacterized protein LOC133905226 n=1 Tax=Phragmites australis TaxID=29695 RepID=UPI002D784BF5|nr:uncharacterized protein LOC133905226 [Phragmites australis]
MFLSGRKQRSPIWPRSSRPEGRGCLVLLPPPAAPVRSCLQTERHLCLISKNRVLPPPISLTDRSEVGWRGTEEDLAGGPAALGRRPACRAAPLHHRAGALLAVALRSPTTRGGRRPWPPKAAPPCWPTTYKPRSFFYRRLATIPAAERAAPPHHQARNPAAPRPGRTWPNAAPPPAAAVSAAVERAGQSLCWPLPCVAPFPPDYHAVEAMFRPRAADACAPATYRWRPCSGFVPLKPVLRLCAVEACAAAVLCCNICSGCAVVLRLKARLPSPCVCWPARPGGLVRWCALRCIYDYPCHDHLILMLNADDMCRKRQELCGPL